MRGSIAAFACALCACVSAPAVAAGRVDNHAATRAYLRASEAYAGSATTEVAARVAATEARASEIAGECPAALTYAPRDEAFEELGAEATTIAFWAGYASVRAAGLRLADAIAHLRWTDRRLTRLVHAVAAQEQMAAALALPDVCADIAAWKASAYATPPQSTTRFLVRSQAIESLSSVGFTEESSETLIWRLLRRFERPAEIRAAKRIEHVEAHIGKRVEAATVAARAKLAAGLGVAAL